MARRSSKLAKKSLVVNERELRDWVRFGGFRNESEAVRGAVSAAVAIRRMRDAEQVVWYVDGAPFRVVEWPYTTRWALAPGEHTFQARLPFAHAASEAVRLRVE